jgi:gamma-glutamylcyclotransferase (GGCT)/AIG2-like uncharacterized protein YtfP
LAIITLYVQGRRRNVSDDNASTSGIRVFVYGTLKQGHGNHRALKNARYLGRCYVEGHLRLIDLGWYPALVKSDGTEKRRVYGEVYRIDTDTLAALDCIEGHPSYYTRRKIVTPFKKAWAYFLPTEYESGEYETLDMAWEPDEAERRFIDVSQNRDGT